MSSHRYVLRPATAADVAGIVAVWMPGWREAHLGNVPDELVLDRTEAAFVRHAEERIPTTTVAVTDDVVLGFVATHGDEVEQLYVGPQARGGGPAAALLAAAERRIAASSPSAFLAVVAGNARARRFYQRQGWADAGAFDHLAWRDGGGVIAVPCHRYIRDLTDLTDLTVEDPQDRGPPVSDAG